MKLFTTKKNKQHPSFNNKICSSQQNKHKTKLNLLLWTINEQDDAFHYDEHNEHLKFN